MSQFTLIEREWFPRVLSPELVLRPLRATDDFFHEIATSYFGDWRTCRLVTDVEGRGESLIDDLYTAQEHGAAIEQTTFMRFLKAAVEAGVQFVIWCSNDYQDLPTAHVWSEVVEQMRRHTAGAPADSYLHFVPPVVGA